METVDLLRRWHAGDQDAFAALIQRHLPWIHARVRDRLGPALREKAESMDLVQDALVEVLRDGPRFTLRDEDAFRALLARIVENSIRDRNDHFAAKKRAADRETALPGDSVLDLDPPAASVTRPSEAAIRHEQAALVQLALKLLGPRDREIIVLRQQEELSFAAIGERLSIPEDTARFRFQRALPRLAKRIEDLRSGRLREALGEP
jgi:RNA polymerase sigma-70 factor (ECF subfamily)